MGNPAQMEASAGAVLTDEDGRVLIVKPTYKPGWNLPGGGVDEGETPRCACRRELHEELGLDVEPGRLLVHAFVAVVGRKPHVYYIFDGGTLTPEQQSAITLQVGELAEHRFRAPQDIPDRDIPPRVRPLWEAALDVRAAGTSTYLELPAQGDDQ